MLWFMSAYLKNVSCLWNNFFSFYSQISLKFMKSCPSFFLKSIILLRNKLKQAYLLQTDFNFDFILVILYLVMLVSLGVSFSLVYNGFWSHSESSQMWTVSFILLNTSYTNIGKHFKANY